MVNLLLTKFVQDRTRRMSALGIFFTRASLCSVRTVKA